MKGTDYDLDGIGIPANAIVLAANAAIKKEMGDADAILAHEEIENRSRHKIHVKPRERRSGTRVASTPSAHGSYTTGETITIEVAFDRNVQVHTPADSEMGSGIPSFELRFGVPYDTTPHHARYARVVDGSRVQFDYVVQAGDSDPDGILSHDPGIHWNGGAIMRAEMDARILTDGAGNDDRQLTDVRADIGGTVLLVQRAHAVNMVATDIELSMNREMVDENAGALSLTVTGTLNGPPLTTDTTVTVSVGNSGDTATEGTDYSTVDDFTLTIAAGESSGMASFTLTPTDDELKEGDEVISVTGSTTATGLSVTGTDAVIVERGVAVSATALEVPEGGNSAYTVVLKSEPTATVTVTPSVSGSSDVRVSPTSLSFTTSDWNEARTVTVSAARDDDAANDTATVAHTVSGGDYASVTAADVAVTVKDDTSERVTLTVSAATVGEAVGATSITVTGTLNGVPRTADTTVAVAVGGSGDTATEGTDYATVDEFPLTISQGQTSGTATFSLTPTNDAVVEGAETLSVTGSTTATGLTVVGTKVKIIDDEKRGVSVSIAGAEADEDDGQIVFTVSLSRPLRRIVSVDFETISGGTATENVDYRPQTTELMIFPGAMSGQAGVSLIDDAIDDDGETVMVRIGNARVMGAGGTVVRTLPIGTATATGTIKNTDLMPQSWLARFGRTVADQVMEAVEGRVTAARSPGADLTVAGQAFGGAEPDEDDMREAEARLERLSTWFRDEGDEERLGLFETRAVDGREVLAGTSFALTEGTAESGFGSVWGRGAVTRFDGREGELTLDGDVESALLGADVAQGRWAAGLAIGHSRAEGGYRSPQGDGAVESTLTGVYPYGRYDVNDWLSLWGVAGMGTGSLTLTPAGMTPIETDMDLRMAALGGRNVLLEAPADGGLELAATSDAMVVQTTSDEVRGSGGSLAASDADVTRLRIGLEGTWRGIGALEPSFEIGLRQDGGDAESGFGADIGAGLAWTDPERGFAAEVRARGLLTHEDRNFKERGFAGSFAWDPDPASDLGPSLSLRQTVGAQASGGVDALLRPDSAEELIAAGDDEDDLRNRRLEATLGYGLSTFGGRYVTTPALGFGLTEVEREVSHSWRLAEARGEGLVFGLDIEALRREPVTGDAGPEHRFAFGLGWQLEGARHEGAALELRLEGVHSDTANDNAKPETLVGVRMTTRW